MVRRFQSSGRINPNSHPKEREWDNHENISRINVLNNSQRIFTKVILSRIEETLKLIICGESDPETSNQTCSANTFQ